MSHVCTLFASSMAGGRSVSASPTQLGSRSVFACFTLLFPLPFWLKRLLMARLVLQGSSPWRPDLTSSSTQCDFDAFSASRSKVRILRRGTVASPPRRPTPCLGSCVDPCSGSAKGPSFAVGDKVPFGCRLQLGPSRSELGQLPLLGLDPEGVTVRVESRRGLRLVTQFLGPTGEQSPAGWGPGPGAPLVPFRTHPKRGGGWSGESPVRSLTASSQVISRNRSRELDGGFYSSPR